MAKKEKSKIHYSGYSENFYYWSIPETGSKIYDQKSGNVCC